MKPRGASLLLTAHRIKVKRALFNEIATPGDGARDGQLPCASTKRTSHWPAPMRWEAPVRFRVILAVAAFALAGCNANQAINPSGQANLCANDPTCNPYDPSSYAQNNVGIGR